MKRLLLVLLLLFLLSSCDSESYTIISSAPVDGFDIYQKEHSSILCNSYWEDIYYSGDIYNFGYRYQSCSADMSYFIRDGNGTYIYLRDALQQNIITLESLLEELEELERQPEQIETDKADYYWLDFHIGPDVVYAYAGGSCDQAGSETFLINGTTYEYRASGCLQEHILYLRIDGEEVPVADLLDTGDIDGTLLIPLLLPVES